MRQALLYIVLLICGSVSGQSLHFDEFIHDFGVIQMNSGEVSHRFEFSNKSGKPVEILSLQSSCGCTVADLSGKKFDPGEHGFIDVTYDPKNRPGWFMKSIKIGTESGKDTLFSYISVKGISVDADPSIITPSNKKIHYDIRIKPFTGTAISEYDTSYLSSEDFNTFINDITYIIDEQNFVELTIKVDMARSSENVWDDIASTVKRNVIYALKRRKYSQHSVGFEVERGNLSTDNEMNASTVTIDAPGFTDESLKKSIIKPVYKEAGRVDREIKISGLDTLFIEPYVLDLYRKHGYKAELDPDSRDYARFVRRTVRATLTDGHSDLGLRVVMFEPEGNRKKAIKKYDKHLDKIKKDLKQRLLDEGLAEASFNFLNHKVEVYDIPSTAIDHDTVNFIQLTRYYVPPEYHGDTTEITWDTVYREVSDLPYQNLPVYLESMNAADNEIDTSSIRFSRSMGQVLRQIRDGHKVSFVIESCASRMSSPTEGSPGYRAMERGKEARSIIRSWLVSRDVNEDMIDFKPIIDVIKGPEHHWRVNKGEAYRKFEYIKIIPTYSSTYKPSRADALIPYRINFDTDIKELPTETVLFQNFISKMAEVITKQGYVRLIVESSSSRIPSTIYRSNRLLSYYRAESAEENIKMELRKRGVDPRKMILVEQRPLVQGPRYDSELDRRVYAEFQYVKVIPEAILRE